jgi:hypothetical protein
MARPSLNFLNLAVEEASFSKDSLLSRYAHMSPRQFLEYAETNPKDPGNYFYLMEFSDMNFFRCVISEAEKRWDDPVYVPRKRSA